MSKAKALMTMAYVFLALLAIAAGMTALGQRDTTTNPVASSYGPSGASAFYSLLVKSGYQVVVDQAPRPRLRTGDLAIAFVPRVEYDGAPSEAPEDRRTEETLRRFAEAGGTVLVLPFSTNFINASRDLMRQPPVRTRSNLKVVVGADKNLIAFTRLMTGRNVELWPNAVDGWTLGKGRVICFRDGLLATNRFIDREDDAVVLLSVIGGARGNGRLVLTEATAGNAHDPGLLARIGNWATVAWYQALLTILLVALTLGVRFGFPEKTRTRQRGSRELVDAVADTMKRGRKARAALLAALSVAEARIRETYKIPRDASPEERDRVLPESVTLALREALVAADSPELTPSRALEMSARIDALGRKPDTV